MTRTHNIFASLVLTAFACSATSPAMPGADLETDSAKAFSMEELPVFMKTYCADCHNPEKEKGDIDLTPIIENLDLAGTDILEHVFDMVSFLEMPPEDENQPSYDERQQFLKGLGSLLPGSEIEMKDLFAQPAHGNYVNHEKLFTEPGQRKAATPVRLWRMSPHIFKEQANRISRTVMLRVQANQGSDGLHPAFSYMTPPHAFRDHAEAHSFEEATTELLFNVCWQISGYEINSPKSSDIIQGFLKLKTPAKEDWKKMIRLQYSMALRRDPTEEEFDGLIALGEKTRTETGIREALQTVLTAVLLKPEAVYRFEIGQGEPDQYGRVFLAPNEVMHAIAFALTDKVPDPSLTNAMGTGKLETRADVRKQVERLLANREATKERILRFFQEYFEYPSATEVFKDARRPNAIFANNRVADADDLVLWILGEDRDVLKRLLTEEHLFVSRKAILGREPVVFRARRDFLPDYGFQNDWVYNENQPVKPTEARRSGMLTHPAWLLAFSDNEKNQAIQRGKWIQTKLLGGTIPETPIGVDAKLPDDPHLTLREKMGKVTNAEYCWRCHQKMDPLGLPLEQFDDFGRFRKMELDKPVVTTGRIAIGDPELDGPITDSYEMMERLANSTRVEQVFVRHVFRYFLGRNETIDDAPTLIDAHNAYRENNGSMKALVASLLTSDSFLYRQLPPESMQASNN